MKVTTDLMEAYSNHVDLPLLLVNLNGEIDYKTDGNNRFLSIYESMPLLLKLKNVSLQLSKPTVMSVEDDSCPSNVFFIVTPVFNVNNSKKFLAAGPFIIETKNINQNFILEKNVLNVYSDDEIEERLEKIKNLFLLLKNKEKVETKNPLPEKFLDILQKIGTYDFDPLDYDKYIYNILDEILNIDVFDFIGIAKKNEDDIFSVKYVSGEKVQHLMGKRLYIGEGLLGKAIILGKDFYWCKEVDTGRNEFFNRYGIFPNHLFGFTLKQEKAVSGIIFGGSFKKEIISENILKFLKCIVTFVAQKKKDQLMAFPYLNNVFTNLLDLLEILTYVNDRKYISYKILDFCLSLNNGNFTCFSTVNNEFIYRGKMNEQIIQIHQKMALDLRNNKNETLWIDQNCIHFFLDFDRKHYGYFTVEFDENTNLNQMYYILDLMLNIILKKEKATTIKSESIFQLLHSSMKEMNHHQHYLSQLSLKFLKKIIEVIPLPDESQEKLLNICKVLPYGLSFLQKNIGHTEEWILLQELQSCLNNRKSSEELKIECKILYFIYKVIILGEGKKSVEFNSDELNETLMKVYVEILQSTEDGNNKFIEGIENKQIKELNDLQNVISTLSLTPREKEILYLILKGLNNQEVGDYLNISVHTVKNHVSNIYKKLNVSDRVQAMVKIYRIQVDDFMEHD